MADPPVRYMYFMMKHIGVQCEFPETWCIECMNIIDNNNSYNDNEVL